jgi:hypothetical protein
MITIGLAERDGTLTAVAVDPAGRPSGLFTTDATVDGVAEMTAWIGSYRPCRFVIDDAASGLNTVEQELHRRGEQVVGIPLVRVAEEIARSPSAQDPAACVARALLRQEGVPAKHLAFALRARTVESRVYEHGEASLWSSADASDNRIVISWRPTAQPDAQPLYFLPDSHAGGPWDWFATIADPAPGSSRFAYRPH